MGYVEGGNVFTYLLRPLIWLTSRGGNADNSRIASVILFTFFFVLRALVAYFLAQPHLDHSWSSAVIALAATFFGPMVNPMTPHDIYPRQIPAIVCHNSTDIMVAPFALMAFWAAVRLLRTLTLRAALIGVTAVFIVVLVRNLLSLELVLAWSIPAVALVQATVFAGQLADGSVAQSGNWFWGTYTA